MAKLGTEFQRKGTGGYKLGESHKKILSSSPLHSYSIFNSPLLNVVVAPISDVMNIDQIVTQAQEQLQLAMKVQGKERKERIWVEEDQKAQQEWNRVVASDKEAAESASGVVVKHMWAIFCQESSDFI